MDKSSFNSFRDIFAFSRAEMIALCFLLITAVAGGGILVYENLSSRVPVQLIFEELPLNPAADPATPVAAAPTPAAGTSLPNLLVNLNTAPAESLVLVPYIGEVLSQRIIEYREQYGGFDSVGQLVAIRGIGPKNIEKFRRYFIVE